MFEHVFLRNSYLGKSSGILVVHWWAPSVQVADPSSKLLCLNLWTKYSFMWNKYLLIVLQISYNSSSVRGIYIACILLGPKQIMICHDYLDFEHKFCHFQAKKESKKYTSVTSLSAPWPVSWVHLILKVNQVNKSHPTPYNWSHDNGQTSLVFYCSLQ